MMNLTNLMKEQLEILQAIREMEFEVIDRLTPFARKLVNEHGDPGIKALILAGVPGPVILQEVENWACSIPVISQPQRAV